MVDKVQVQMRDITVFETHHQPCPWFCEEEKCQRELSQTHTFLSQFELGFVDPNPVFKNTVQPKSTSLYFT